MKTFIVSSIASILFSISCHAQQLSVSDIISLKTNGISDEVIIALIQSRTNIINTSTTNSKSVNIVSMDVDSYDFFKYHYLYPRALSYRYRLLSPYIIRHRDLWH